MLAHRASAQGEMVAEIVGGKRRAWDRTCIPAICFTDPEVVVAGLTPDAARAANIEIATDAFPFRANGRAMTLASDTGFIRMVARADNHLLLGIQGVGAGISELSAAFSLAIEMGARLEDVAGVAVEVRLAGGTKCARSWKVLPSVGSDPAYPDVSPRDAKALREWETMRKAAE